MGFTSVSFSQNFDMMLLDDTTLSGPADPMIPIIFHFEADNLTDSTFHVEMYRSEVNIPEGWETALCTEACFPPEVSEAVFFMDEMAIDEASFYFYPSSVGSGQANVLFINREDSTNYFQYTLYANSEPLSIDDIQRENQSILISQNGESLTIKHNLPLGQSLSFINMEGKVVLETTVDSSILSVGISDFSRGIYFVKFQKEKAIKISIR